MDKTATVAVSDTYYENVKILEKTLLKADLWTRRHAARFAPDKFELIHFKKPRLSMLRSTHTTSLPTTLLVIIRWQWQSRDMNC